MEYFFCFIQSFIILLLTPLFSGLLRRIKASLRGYTGNSIFQVYYDIYKLLEKDRVVSKSSTFITQLGPIIILTSSVAAMFLVPVFYTNMNMLIGNLFIIIFLLAINKFINTMLGMDCASTFGGMGSSRELFISMFAEPIIFVIISFLYIETNTFNIFSISAINSANSNFGVAHIIAAVAMFIVIIAENTRLPVDNPETHLELTMVHEAMILDISGKDLAIVELSSQIKLILFFTIFINTFFPIGISTTIAFVPILKSTLLFFGKLGVCIFLLSIIESSIAKSRLFRVPELLAMGISLSVLAVTINYFI